MSVQCRANCCQNCCQPPIHRRAGSGRSKVRRRRFGSSLASIIDETPRRSHATDGAAPPLERRRLSSTGRPSDSLPTLVWFLDPKGLVILIVLTSRIGSPVMLRSRIAGRLDRLDASELLPGYASHLGCVVELTRPCDQGLKSPARTIRGRLHASASYLVNRRHCPCMYVAACMYPCVIRGLVRGLIYDALRGES
jgi:hypothetical protein